MTNFACCERCGVIRVHDGGPPKRLCRDCWEAKAGEGADTFCADCGLARRIKARGLCRACHRANTVAGTLDRYAIGQSTGRAPESIALPPGKWVPNPNNPLTRIYKEHAA